MMRVLTILSLLGAALWSGWWYVGSTAADRGAREGITALQADGWAIAYDDLSVSGFPNRFDTRLTALDMATPDGLWGATLPRLQVFALSYRPNEVIVVPANAFNVETPFGPVDVTADDLRASAALSLSTTPDLSRATAVGQTLSLKGPDWTALLTRGQLAMRQADDPQPHAYDLALSLADLGLSGAAIDPRLPGLITAVEFDGRAYLDAPLAEDGRLAALTLRRAHAAWDDISLTLSGDLTVDASGHLDGILTLRIRGWRDLITLATQFGLPPTQAALLGGGLAGLETDGVAEVPLTLRGGAVLFGTIPLAALPRLPAPRPVSGS